jgi:hypothetical protein
MKKNWTGAMYVAVLSLVLGSAWAGDANLPADFPKITTTIYDANALGEGTLFLAAMPGDKSMKNLPYYLLMLNNDGTPRAYKKVYYKVPGDYYENDFKVLPNGLLHYSQFFGWYSYAGGGVVVHVILDEDLNEVERIQMGNGFAADSHDFEMMPNGHCLLIGYYTTLTNLSQIIPGAYPRAEVSGTILQELDADRNVVFQWRAWDHFSFAEYPYWNATATAPASAAWHGAAVRLDEKDGNIFLDTTEEVMKVNRQTGEVMWRLGGAGNQFTFVGVDPNEGALEFQGHDFHRLANGNVIILNGGTANATRTSRVHEYALDEVHKIATHVWSYVPDEMIATWARGSAQRLANGNTFISWGTANPAAHMPPDCTEVTADGRKVFELRFDNAQIDTYRAFRVVYPPKALRIEVQKAELASGNTYKFIEGKVDTGVTLDIMDRVGDGYNVVTVAREPYAPLAPSFPGKAPRLLPVRIALTGFSIESITGRLSLDAQSFGIIDPNRTTVYYRPFQGHGLFIPLATDYNWVTGQLRAFMDGLGEFTLGIPDVTEIPFAPLLIEPESLQTGEYVTRVPPLVQDGKPYSVNQALPVTLSWTPQGMASSYRLQVAKDPGFSAPAVDAADLTQCRYTLDGLEPNSPYYWRVGTTNDGGASDWATSSFATVPPMIRVTSPNGGESWQRGLKVFIQWDDNLNEDVVIELYKAGVRIKTLATVPSLVSFKWEVGLDLEPGSDYAIKIKSSKDEGLSDMSDSPFAIQ